MGVVEVADVLVAERDAAVERDVFAERAEAAGAVGPRLPRVEDGLDARTTCSSAQPVLEGGQRDASCSSDGDVAADEVELPHVVRADGLLAAGVGVAAVSGVAGPNDACVVGSSAASA